MQKFLIWVGVVVLISAIFVPYVIGYRRRQRVTAERRKEAHHLGIDRPRAHVSDDRQVEMHRLWGLC